MAPRKRKGAKANDAVPAPSGLSEARQRPESPAPSTPGQSKQRQHNGSGPHVNGTSHSRSADTAEMGTSPGWMGEAPGLPANSHLHYPPVAHPHPPTHGSGHVSGVDAADGDVGGVPERELGAMALLVLLYMVQGVPLGLTTGALPFMLSSKVSYTEMGIFSLAAYPYSLKLLWSPVVDSVYSRRVGRRKSWIVPIQLITAALLLLCSDYIQVLFDAADVWRLTTLFLVFVFLMATQDIAVDGWALTLLSPANVSYASTCQTVGQTTGIFTSFTVFLALQDAAFCNTYIRGNAWFKGLVSPEHQDVGLVTLSGYMRFWGYVFAAVTLAIWLLKKEAPEEEEEQEGTHGSSNGKAGSGGAAGQGDKNGAKGGNGSGSGGHVKRKRSNNTRLTEEERQLLTGRQRGAVAAAGDGGEGSSGSGRKGGGVGAELVGAYVQLWRVIKLPAVWQLTALLLTYRLGVLAAEGAASLKLIDKGVAKEALAFLVLFQFPVELLSAIIAGRWAANHSPYYPFIIGYMLRLLTAAATVALTAWFPPGASSLATHGREFGALAAVSLATSFVSYLSFTALGSFFNTISDPDMGGAYLTLLNTIANMGFLLPRTPMFWLMDVLTVARCSAREGGPERPTGQFEGVEWAGLKCPKKVMDMGKAGVECVDAGGVCSLASDGYYLVSSVSLVVGLLLGLVYVGGVKAMMRLPLEKWRPQKRGGTEAKEE